MRFVERERFAYLAGLIDGEGTITITRHTQQNRRTYQYKPFVWVVNTDKKMIEFVVENFVGKGRMRVARRGVRKPIYLWRVMSLDNIKHILEGCLPFLVTKKEHAEILLEYVDARNEAYKGNHQWNGYGDIEHQCYARVSVLNIRGFRNY